MIYQAWAEMERRYARIESGAASEDDFEPLILVLDEYRDFYAIVAEWYAGIKVTGMPTRCPVLEKAREEHRNGNWRQRRSCDGAGRKPDAAWRPTGPIARVAADAETSHLMRQRLQPGRIRSGPAFTLASVLVVGSAKRSLPGPDLGASGQSSSGASGARSARRAPARSGRWKE